jgi:signal transduction histidine kinase
MKLLAKTSFYYLIFSLLLFAIGGAIFYLQLKKLIDEDYTENLYLEKEQVLKYVDNKKAFPQSSFFFGDQFTYSKAFAEMNEQLKDTLLYNSLEEEIQLYRQLIFGCKINDQYYSVTISKSMFDSVDMIEGIGFSLAIISGFMLVLLLLFTRVISKKMWKPFYTTLDGLKNFDVNKNEKLIFSATKTEEFQLLNFEIETMTQKIQKDYMNLKEFTENASHEIQTPLAIIGSKLELILQSENLKSSEIKLVSDALESTFRLSKLNQTLLLLTKIENLQFDNPKNIDLKKLIDFKINQLEELIIHKNITIKISSHQSMIVFMNEELADILVSNLIINAIKHNIINGYLAIEFKNEEIIFSNSGDPITVSNESLFNRFQKSNQTSDSLGLGLSLVKQICNVYHFDIKYEYGSNIHSIIIRF